MSCLFISQFSFANLCPALPSPVVLADTPKEVSILWENMDREILDLKEPIQDPLLKEYQEWIGHNTNVNQIYLLKKQRHLFQKHFPKDAKQIDLIISGQAGSIEPLRCLDSLLFLEHIKRGHLRDWTEFKATILSLKGRSIHSTRPFDSENKKRIKIYFTTQSNGGSVLPNHLIESCIKEDLQSGWQIEYELHNHPFIFDNPSGDIAGTVVPSRPDLSFYLKRRELGLREARITNGIDTLRTSSEDWKLLSAVFSQNMNFER